MMCRSKNALVHTDHFTVWSVVVFIAFILMGADAKSQSRGDQGRISQEIPHLQSSQNLTKAANASGGAAVGIAESDELDIGEQQLVVSKESFQTLGVYLSTNLFYTDNAALSAFRKLDDWGWNSSITLQWNPKVSESLFVDVMLREDFYRYDRFKDILDFDSFRATAGMLYFVPKISNTFIFAKYQIQLTTLPWDWDEALYENHSIQTGVQKVFYFSKGNQVVVQLGAEFSFESEPSVLRRNEYMFQIQHVLRWTPKIQSSLVYRLAYQDYREFSEMSSWNQVLSARVQYSLLNSLSIGLSATFLDNQASESRFDYDMFTASLMLDLQFRF